MTPRTLTALLLSFGIACTAEAGVPASAGADIDKVNEDWGIGMVKGDAKLIAAAYAPQAVFCDAEGACTSGHDAIEKMTEARLDKGPLPLHAEAHTTRRIMEGELIYEWGSARITGADGTVRGGGYFTLWQRQPDGHWKIIRNLVLPAPAKTAAKTG